jgi:hypothetical protein
MGAEFVGLVAVTTDEVLEGGGVYSSEEVVVGRKGEFLHLGLGLGVGGALGEFSDYLLF